jgi:hypothetical protein
MGRGVFFGLVALRGGARESTVAPDAYPTGSSVEP